MEKTEKKSFWHLFREGLIHGLAWSIGATVGIALLTTILASILSRVGGVPVIGNFVATIVEAAIHALSGSGLGQ